MDGNLAKILAEKKDKILESWQETALASYHPKSAAFMRQQTDRFANPVGYAITSSMSALLDNTVMGRGVTEAYPVLDSIVRIRAVQDFSPSQAIAFLFQLKPLLRRELDVISDHVEMAGEWKALAERIDCLALAAFDIYMNCRQQLYDLRIKELKRGWQPDQGRSLWQDAQDQEQI